MAQNIMQTAVRLIGNYVNSVLKDRKKICKQPFDGSKHYVHIDLIAQNIMSSACPWLKTLCEHRFDGSKDYSNNVSMAQNIT